MLLGPEGWSQPKNTGRRRADAERCLRLKSIGRCCGRGIEQIQKEVGRGLVEHHLDCGYTGTCVIPETLQVKEGLEGGLGYVVLMMMEEKSSVTEVSRSIVRLGQCYEWGTTRRAHWERILKIQQQVHGLDM